MTLLTHKSGVTPAIETRRGFPGVMLGGLWMPLPVIGGDGEGEGSNEGAGAGGSNNNPPPNTPPANQAGSGSGDESQFSEQARLTIQKLRGELKDAKAGSKRADDLQAKLDEYEKGQLSEKERLERERDEARNKATETETRARQRVIRSEVRVVASELGFADPSDAHRFLDDDAIELDEDGEPKNVKALLEKLAKDKPYLLKSEGGTNGVPPTPRGNGHRETHEERVEKTLQEMGTRYRLP